MGESPGPPRKPGQSLTSLPPPAGRDEGPASEPDEALVDECCLLPSQLLIPSLDWLPVSDGLVSRLQPKQPLRLRFGKAPALPGSAAALQLDGLARCVPCGRLPLSLCLRPRAWACCWPPGPCLAQPESVPGLPAPASPLHLSPHRLVHWPGCDVLPALVSSCVPCPRGRPLLGLQPLQRSR